MKALPVVVGSLAVFLAAAGSAQVWEKSIAPGMTYRMEFEPMVPRIVHSLRVVPTAPSLRAEAAIPKKVLFSEGPEKGRGTVTQMVTAAQATAGVNADFFPWSGDPLGLMVRGGEMISAPGERAYFAWGPGGATVGQATFSMHVILNGGEEIPLTSWNEDPGLNRAGVFTPAAGAVLAKTPSHRVKLSIPAETQFGVTGEIFGTVVRSETALTDGILTPIEPGTVWLAANGTAAPQFQALKEGDKAIIRYRVRGFDETKFDHAVAGGPFLVRNSQVSVDAEAQRFNDAFSKKRHPRTAAGRTAEGDLVFTVVDGRQPMSAGATLEEMAVIMRRLGCVEAINLDGGGSSAISLRGVLLNRPSDNVERPVANGVVFYAPDPIPSGSSLRMKVTPTMTVGQWQPLTILDPGGTEVPNVEVVWSAQGAGWIDQGGMFRAFKPGPADVAASVRGKVIRVRIEVAEKPVEKVPPPARKPSKNKRAPM